MLLLDVTSAERTAEPDELVAKVRALWESRGYVVRAGQGEAFGRAPDGGALTFLAGAPQGRMVLKCEGACRWTPPP